MIEKIILDYLNTKLSQTQIKAYMELPEGEDPVTCVVIEKTGSSENNYLRSATLAIQSYGTSLYEAASLNEMVKTFMEEAVSLSDVSKCKLNTDYVFNDVTRKRYRYQAVFEINHY
ncbi:MAG: hypothetical protein K6F63_03885 [Lachnospiraceae bacterium]|nr:hypothetical protein [Lachnospiraceae bacterium]